MKNIASYYNINYGLVNANRNNDLCYFFYIICIFVYYLGI